MDSDEGEEGVGLPHAAVLRVARAAVPIASFSKEAQTALPSCCEQFVRLVTAEMVLQIDQEQRSLVSVSDVGRACETLGFDFGEEFREAQDEMESKKKALKLRKSSQAVISPEERARLQEAMFADAAKEMMK